MGERKRGRQKHVTTNCFITRLLLSAVVLLPLSWLTADPVPVRHIEGLTHGFLALHSVDGKKLADGEMTQVIKGDHVHSHLVFRFYDGSLYDDQTEFTQEKSFRLISDHLVEKGPSFKKASDTLIDATKGEVTLRSKDDHGKEKVSTEKMELPQDLSNGLLNTVVKDIPPNPGETNVSLLAGSDKPQIVRLVIRREGERQVVSGKQHHKATVYDVKVDIGGVKGVLAKMVGKKPPDTHMWVLEGEAPTFIQSEGPLYEGGPVWRIELTSPKVSR